MISAKKIQLPKRQNAVVPPPQREEISPEVVETSQSSDQGAFRPPPIDSIEKTGLTESLVESLLFKHLFAAGHITGRGLSTSMGLPAKPIIELLAKFKAQQFVYHKDSTAMGDFEYALSDAGRERAKGFIDECAYAGPVPVTLSDYINSVSEQSITLQRAGLSDLRRAFDGMLINDKMFARLGPAINSGRGLFLYGSPGNGKTSIAERVASCLGGTVWVPYAIHVAGETITFYDPENHHSAEPDGPKILKSQAVDPRWKLIHRPTIIAGGELTMESLELKHDPYTKITEPSLQLKSNTGILVIDDFGRQRVSPIEMLNRWIVPLEHRYDFLTLANGKKIRVPFDQLIIFSTNLEPKHLVDEAFLRRIPYKINVIDPTEDEFRELFEITAQLADVELGAGAVESLIQKHYKDTERPFRCCHPRDLLLQIKNLAAYNHESPLATAKKFDEAVENYFSML